MNENENKYVEKRIKLGLPEQVSLGQLVSALEQSGATELLGIVGTRDSEPVEVRFR